jgi:hypothetical protein
MKKIRLLLPLLAFSCAAAMAQVTTTTTTTRHSTSIEPAISVPTVVTVHTHTARHVARRHVRRVRHVAVRKSTHRVVAATTVVNTRRMGAPAAPGTSTTTVTTHSSRTE